jgi:hypothetical protein
MLRLLDERMRRRLSKLSLSDDHADAVGDYKFNPLVLAEIQTGADSRETTECRGFTNPLHQVRPLGVFTKPDGRPFSS